LKCVIIFEEILRVYDFALTNYPGNSQYRGYGVTYAITT